MGTKKYNRREVLLRFVKNHLKELNLEDEVFNAVEQASKECADPRRDGTPCFWCPDCYKRWTAELKFGIKHDKAVDSMMAMYEDRGRE